MKLATAIPLSALLLLVSFSTLTKSSERLEPQKTRESFVVTFECNSCTKRNKFYISGPDEHTFNAVEFPLEFKLKSGSYEMTYWQNRIRQIHLPFNVSPGSENIIVVKD
jgi:hypothetical protein